MASDFAINVDQISKVYRLGLKEHAKDSISASVVEFIKSPLKNYRKYKSLYNFDDIASPSEFGKNKADVLWALKGVTFNVQEGEVLGVIGRNGAGKSTLLKILTKITTPTTGNAQLRGRVSSLLEVGTGFHQELTGRENVYLNGTILGMTKKEVDRKFDQIIDFSGVERFIDTPVKRYSSGMKVRLAFSVAAHLEPEILIIDEVLAVGDSAFQKKCIEKMKDVGQRGRTVLFVSHNMPAITMLCDRAILLNEGSLEMQGTANDVVSRYLQAETGASAIRKWDDASVAPGGRFVRLRSVRIISEQGQTTESIDIREKVGIEMVYEVLQSDCKVLPHYHIYNESGVIIFTTLDQDPRWKNTRRQAGKYTSTAWIPGNFLNEGKLFITCAMLTLDPDSIQFDECQIVSFTVTDNMGDGTARGDWGGPMDGAVRPLLDWTTQYQQA